MRTKQLLITPDEAFRLFDFDTFQTVCDADEFHKKYVKDASIDGGAAWYTAQLYAFVYFAGRLQGIREERASRKKKQS